MEFTDMILPWIAVLISLVVAIWFKDFAQSLAKGLRFKMNPAFNEGDEVILTEDILGDMYQMKEYLFLNQKKL